MLIKWNGKERLFENGIVECGIADNKLLTNACKSSVGAVLLTNGITPPYCGDITRGMVLISMLLNQ